MMFMIFSMCVLVAYLTAQLISEPGGGDLGRLWLFKKVVQFWQLIDSSLLFHGSKTWTIYNVYDTYFEAGGLILQIHVGGTLKN